MYPLFIISHNRLSCLQTLIDRVQDAFDVHIVDNASTYEPLLDYLSTTPHIVHKLGENIGHHAPWIADVIPANSFYAVTDPDVIPVDECDLIVYQKLSYEILRDNHHILKVGLGLKIDDLPDHYKFKQEVINWENRWWVSSGVVNGMQIYNACVDTTFAVYKPNTDYTIYPALRLGQPFLARHLPWYSDSDNPTEEDLYYTDNTSRTISTWLYNDIANVALREMLGL